jgi:hypothetical protein
MTTANKTAAKKSASNAVVGAAVNEKLEAGQEPQAPAPEMKQGDKLANKRLTEISDEVCISAMQKALGFGKAALHTECSIALLIFATDHAGVNKSTKARVMSVYKDAGYDVGNIKGDDYKTCNRRMNVFASFYTKLGAPKVRKMVDDAREAEAIEALKNFLTTEYNFRGVNDIIEATTGKKPKQTNTPAARAARAQAATPAPAAPAEAPASVSPPSLTVEGQHLNMDGTPDKRSAPEGEMAEGQKTRAEHGLQGTTKAEAGMVDAKSSAPAPSPADNAVMAAMGEKAQERPQADVNALRTRRHADNGICLIAGALELSIPYGTTGADIQAMYAKLTVLAGNVRDETIIDERFNSFSNSPLHETTRQVAH